MGKSSIFTIESGHTGASAQFNLPGRTSFWSAKDRKTIMEIFGERIVEDCEERASAKKNPEGKKWAPNAPSWAKRKGFNSPLKHTGDLLSTPIDILELTESRVVVGLTDWLTQGGMSLAQKQKLTNNMKKNRAARKAILQSLKKQAKIRSKYPDQFDMPTQAEQTAAHTGLPTGVFFQRRTYNSLSEEDRKLVDAYRTNNKITAKSHFISKKETYHLAKMKNMGQVKKISTGKWVIDPESFHNEMSAAMSEFLVSKKGRKEFMDTTLGLIHPSWHGKDFSLAGRNTTLAQAMGNIVENHITGGGGLDLTEATNQLKRSGAFSSREEAIAFRNQMRMVKKQMVVWTMIRANETLRQGARGGRINNVLRYKATEFFNPSKEDVAIQDQLLHHEAVKMAYRPESIAAQRGDYMSKFMGDKSKIGPYDRRRSIISKIHAINDAKAHTLAQEQDDGRPYTRARRKGRARPPLTALEKAEVNGNGGHNFPARVWIGLPEKLVEKMESDLADAVVNDVGVIFDDLSAAGRRGYSILRTRL